MAPLPCIVQVAVALGWSIASTSGWLFCVGDGSCHQHGWQHWIQDPKKLAEQARSSGQPWGWWLKPKARWPVTGQWSQNPPTFRGNQVKLHDIANFIADVLESDPFHAGDGGRRVPWLDFNNVGEGKVVAITQRQLAFIVANAIMGNTIPAQDGLSVSLAKCAARDPSATAYLFSLLSLLAVLSQELQGGEQGSLLIAATPRSVSWDWRGKAESHVMLRPEICEQEAGGKPCGLKDFMTGGTEYQAVTDIAGDVVGGGAQLCDLANSQDESLVQFYGEALAFAFFAGKSGRLPVPWTLLGARRYLSDISGQSSPGAPFFSKCGHIPGTNWLNDEISAETVVVHVDGRSRNMPKSAFVAVASKCAACNGCKVNDAVLNQCEAQRLQLDADVALWYQAYEATMYNAVIQDAFRSVVRRIGTGPWGAGVWYGDSQQYFLTTWLATSLLGQNDVTMDYYVYSNFCENPGNQCFVLGGEMCKSCLSRSGGNPYFVSKERCGEMGVQDIISRFQGMNVKTLYAQLQSRKQRNTDRQVFDLVADGVPIVNQNRLVKHAHAPETFGLASSERWDIKKATVATQLKNNFGLCLDAPEPTVSGGLVHLWKCFDNLPAQTWVYDGETKQIRNINGICLDTSQPHTDGGELHLWTCNEKNIHQRWNLDGVDHRIRNEYNYCVHMNDPRKNGARVHLQACEMGENHQTWYFLDPEGMFAMKDSRGFCLDGPLDVEHSKGDRKAHFRECSAARIRHQLWKYSESGRLSHGNVCLDALPPQTFGSEVVLAKCTGGTSQTWNYNKNTAMLEHSSGMCLDAPEPDAENDGIHLWRCFSLLENQAWAHIDSQGLISNQHGFCLRVSMPAIKGSEVDMWKCNAKSDNQRWHLEESTGLIKNAFGSCLLSPVPRRVGCPLHVNACDASQEAQQWIYNGKTGHIRHINGLCIDSPEANKNGGQVHLWRCLEQEDSQQWI